MISTASLPISKETVECVGLWLAEGDKRCNNEINFSNNCWELIEFFHRNIKMLFKDYKFNIRIYVYTPEEQRPEIPLKNVKINRYVDAQATKPYFIWRLASVELNKKWKMIVNHIKREKEFYQHILRGFFAGEGNVKTGSHSNRCLRIAQRDRDEYLEEIFGSIGINYRFRSKERNYYVTGKDNWDIFAEFKLADLHPIKKEKFYLVYNGFKEEHYKHNYLKNELQKILVKAYSCLGLSKKFRRSTARICEVLMLLKKARLITNFKVKNRSYWIRKDRKIIIVSKIKEKYLRILKENPQLTSQIAKKLGVCWKSAFRRLKELEKLGLVKQNNNKEWVILKNKQEVSVL